MAAGDFKRWLYRGNRPHWFARALNRGWAAFAACGLAPDWLATLEVKGRNSGRTISLPVVVAHVDRERYLVSMLGDQVQWVLNVRAAGGRAVLRSRLREEVELVEVAPNERPPVLKAYLQRAPGARPHLPVRPDAPLEEFEPVAERFPVFRITRRELARLEGGSNE